MAANVEHRRAGEEAGVRIRQGSIGRARERLLCIGEQLLRLRRAHRHTAKRRRQRAHRQAVTVPEQQLADIDPQAKTGRADHDGVMRWCDIDGGVWI